MGLTVLYISFYIIIVVVNKIHNFNYIDFFNGYILLAEVAGGNAISGGSSSLPAPSVRGSGDDENYWENVSGFSFPGRGLFIFVNYRVHYLFGFWLVDFSKATEVTQQIPCMEERPFSYRTNKPFTPYLRKGVFTGILYGPGVNFASEVSQSSEVAEVASTSEVNPSTMVSGSSGGQTSQRINYDFSWNLYFNWDIINEIYRLPDRNYGPILDYNPHFSFKLGFGGQPIFFGHEDKAKWDSYEE